jgi:two-component system NtrC family sensor kinase
MQTKRIKFIKQSPMAPLRFLIIIFLIASFVSTGQDLQQLQRSLNFSKSKKQKVEALNALVEYMYRETEYDSLFSRYSQEMVKIAQESKDKELIAWALLANGKHFRDYDNQKIFAFSKPYLIKCLQFSSDNNLHFYKAAAYIELARFHLYGFEYSPEKAIEFASFSEQLTQQIRNDSLNILAIVYKAKGYLAKSNSILSFRYNSNALEKAKKINNLFLQAFCYRTFGEIFYDLTDYNKAIDYQLKALKIYETMGFKQIFKDVQSTLNNLGWFYYSKGNRDLARTTFYKLYEVGKAQGLNQKRLEGIYTTIFSTYDEDPKGEDAFLKSHPFLIKHYKETDAQFMLDCTYAEIYQSKKRYDSAEYYYKKGIPEAEKKLDAFRLVNFYYKRYINFLFEKGDKKLALFYLAKAQKLSEKLGDPNIKKEIYHLADSVWIMLGNKAMAYDYHLLSDKYKDSINQLGKSKEVALLELQNEQKALQQERLKKQTLAEYQNNIRTYALLSGLGLFIIVSAFLYRNNQQKQKNNKLLEKQKSETEQQKLNAEQTLKKLKATQAQLIQSEKMASLGELTAGIAHEIQNPLNFVNNFSETNTELIEEAEAEFMAGNHAEGFSLLTDIKQNEQKINHHGKRADAIVKGMLQHSKTSLGKKEPTDINTVVDEYLRLSYHGLRAKDKSFNATIETHFDESIGKAEVVPQDIGRVLLNLFNNAFYAVNEKKKALALKGEDYQPRVTVTTKRISSPSEAVGLQISVRDNGNGIPQKVVDKMFQPFFTTKPTGQGTGLGLSLSYDIVKAHGGEIKAQTTEGEGAEFLIQLPDLIQ